MSESVKQVTQLPGIRVATETVLRQQGLEEHEIKRLTQLRRVGMVARRAALILSCYSIAELVKPYIIADFSRAMELWPLIYLMAFCIIPLTIWHISDIIRLRRAKNPFRIGILVCLTVLVVANWEFFWGIAVWLYRVFAG